MLPIVLSLVFMGVCFFLIQSQNNTHDDDNDRGKLIPVRVRANRAPVVRRRMR